MQIEIRSNEFRVFTEVHCELRQAMEKHDRRTAYLAMEELRAMQTNTDWPALRARCNAALSAYSVH
ncbi:hypothetical protein [Pseudorhizobium pelagicum]|uniref:Uncharacterized protein n=1 Tax=Pseudorhizobium pelagicum TaxID=1509405 RepID=A0A922P492_9HYPH|nr:hypothetical protein [Pseudorhizobium pelagicum]KEQ07511.1 hypothetical protein GV67_22415 [Pseudorhizobium pelagicum]KEQ09109.1 hypothetical protein GV68_25435 [Pseudorhizobium pelagicum]